MLGEADGPFLDPTNKYCSAKKETMSPSLIAIVAFLILAVLIFGSAACGNKVARVVLGVVALAWAGIIFSMAGWLESLNYNAWYNGSAAELIDASIEGLEEGDEELVLAELKRLREELNVTYEERGNFQELASGLAARLEKRRAEQGGAEQPATALDSKSEGSEKPKSESEGRAQ